MLEKLYSWADELKQVRLSPHKNLLLVDPNSPFETWNDKTAEIKTDSRLQDIGIGKGFLNLSE